MVISLFAITSTNEISPVLPLEIILLHKTFASFVLPVLTFTLTSFSQLIELSEISPVETDNSIFPTVIFSALISPVVRLIFSKSVTDA